MADAFYAEYRNGMLGGGVHAQPNLATDDIRVALRDEGTVALNLATNIDLDDVSTAHVATSAAFASATVGTVAAGAFDHEDITFASVSGASVESLDYYNYETAVDTTSPMICNIDSSTGLPVTPNGGDITWTLAAGGVFQIT